MIEGIIEKELDKILKEISKLRDKAILIILHYTPTTISDIVRLKLEDISLDCISEPELSVSDTSYSLPIKHANIVQAYINYLRLSEKSEDDLLFTGTRGGTLQRKEIYRLLKQCSEILDRTVTAETIKTKPNKTINIPKSFKDRLILCYKILTNTL